MGQTLSSYKSTMSATWSLNESNNQAINTIIEVLLIDCSLEFGILCTWNNMPIPFNEVL